MKYRVVGWTFYDNEEVEEGAVTYAAWQAIVDEIREKGYDFTGWDHQSNLNCAPVLNDGKIRRFSGRGFGRAVAEAHGLFGPGDYAVYAFVDFEEHEYPKNIFDPKNFTPETDLHETFRVEVDEENFNRALNLEKIKIENLDSLKYLDAGDTLILKCGDKTTSATVYDLDRKKDLTHDEYIAFQARMYDVLNMPKVKKAEKEFEAVPIALYVYFKEEPEEEDTI